MEILNEPTTGGVGRLDAEAVADELAIRSLTARAVDAVNRNLPAELGRLFVSDGEWVVPGVPETRGPDQVAALLAQLLGTYEQLVQLMHSGRVEVRGDEATARWYLSEIARDRAGQGWSFVGTYHDRLTRTPEGWRFVSRRFDFLYRGRTEMPGKLTPFVLPAPLGADAGGEELPWPA